MTKWQGWLKTLNDAGKGGVILRAASRGLQYDVNMTINGADYSGAALVGQVRLSPDGTGNELAAFTFTTPVYDAANDKTTFTFSLAAGTGVNSTGALPVDSDGDGIEAFPFDILMTPTGGSQELLIGGLFTLAGVVTQ